MIIAPQALTNNSWPVWDSKALIICKKGNTEGIEFSMYNKEEADEAILFQCQVYEADFPEAGSDWIEFSVSADTDKEAKIVGDLELVFKIKISDCANDKMSTREDLHNFCQDSDTMAYSEQELIDGEEERDNALLQCWRNKAGSSKAVLWIIGRNDCFMHPNVAKSLFTERGYDLYVLNYSATGMCRKRGWVVSLKQDETVFYDYLSSVENSPIFFSFYQTSSHFNSHNHEGDCNLYLDQIDGAISLINSHQNYDKVVGYGHSTGGAILINYLMKMGDDYFDGFIFNAPFLDWNNAGGTMTEMLGENVLGLMENFGVLSNDRKFGVVPTPERFEEPSVYLGDEIVLSAWSAKLWSQYFFDFRCRTLYSVPITVGFANSMTKVQNEIIEMKNDKKFITFKPVACIASRADDTLSAKETLNRIDFVGPARCELELRHNAHDVFLSTEKSDVDMAVDMVHDWMDAHGYATLKRKP
jgi:hypothetical protein